MKYVIKSVPTDNTQALEDLLNSMSEAGWDLYSMHEVEAEDDGYQYNCIFVTDNSAEEEEENEEDIVNIKSFKSQMEKMLSSNLSAYDSCKEIQEKIKEQRLKIAKVKKQLEAQEEAPISKNRKHLNDEISQGLKNLDELKQSLIRTISPESMYSNFKQERLSIHLSEEILDIVNPDMGAPLIAETVNSREKLTNELGYVMPRITFQDDDELNSYEFSIKIRDLNAQKATTYPGYIAYFEEDLKLPKKQKDLIYDVDPITGKQVVWIDENKTKNFWSNGFNASQYVARILEWTAIKCVDDLLDYSDVNKYIEIVGKQNLYLIENIVPDFVSVAEIRYILASLIRERVSVKDIVYIFEKINDYAEDNAKEDLLDKIRISLSRYISKDLTKESEYIQAFGLSEKTYKILFSNLEEDDSLVRIDGKTVEKIIKKFARKLKSLDLNMSDVIVLAPLEVRHMLFMVLSQYLPNIKVLAKEELNSECTIEIVDEI